MGEGVSGRHPVLVIFEEACPSPRPSSTVGSGCVTEILYGLRGTQRERVAALREGGHFFWLDVSRRASTSWSMRWTFRSGPPTPWQARGGGWSVTKVPH
jgi:hypothetical protein